MKNLRHDQWTKHNKTSNVAYFLLTGEPQDSGISLQTILELGPAVPVFGVCMGLQCMGEAFGGES
jgi:anthranilate/para-aminobenzoate synthase component II